MLRLLADENFSHDIVRGLLRRRPSLDISLAQDADLRATDDRMILDWAARDERLVLTHDANTMPAFAYERIRNGQAMPGMFVVNQQSSLAMVIDDLLLLDECSDLGEWTGLVIYVPLS